MRRVRALDPPGQVVRRGRSIAAALLELRVNLPASSSGDRRLIETWLHGRSPETQRAYLADVVALLQFRRKPLRELTLRDLQRWQDDLQADGTVSSTRRRLASAKSLLSFGHKLGALPVNVGGALRMPAAPNTLVERILSEADVQRMLARTRDAREHALLLTLYATAARNSEVAQLRKRDVQAHGNGGVFSIFGKGGRPRVVRVKPSTFGEVVKILPEDAGEPIFGVGQRQIRRIVKAAAERAGLEADVSPHWLRHAHASHALDRGCPIHLVQQTLGHKSVLTTTAYLHVRPNESSALYLPI